MCQLNETHTVDFFFCDKSGVFRGALYYGKDKLYPDDKDFINDGSWSQKALTAYHIKNSDEYHNESSSDSSSPWSSDDWSGGGFDAGGSSSDWSGGGFDAGGSSSDW